MSSQDTYTLFHNPQCSKSCAAKALLEERGIDFRVFHYLEEPLTEEELENVMRCLGLSKPRPMMREREKIYGELGLDELQENEDLIRAMTVNRVLIERPILVRGDRAVIGRPPERVLELLDE